MMPVITCCKAFILCHIQSKLDSSASLSIEPTIILCHIGQKCLLDVSTSSLATGLLPFVG